MVSRLPEVILVRHGETEWSKNLKHTSRTDLSLTTNGIEQTRKLSKFVFENPHQSYFNPQNISQIYVSPRKRAQETLELINFPNKENIPKFIEPNIAEWDYGDYEGLTTHDIHVTKSTFWNIWNDGAPNGETLDDVVARCDQIITKIMAHQADHTDHRPNEPGGDVLLIAHSHLLRVFTCRWLDMDPENGRYFRLDTTDYNLGRLLQKNNQDFLIDAYSRLLFENKNDPRVAAPQQPTPPSQSSDVYTSTAAFQQDSKPQTVVQRDSQTTVIQQESQPQAMIVQQESQPQTMIVQQESQPPTMIIQQEQQPPTMIVQHEAPQTTIIQREYVSAPPTHIVTTQQPAAQIITTQQPATQIITTQQPTTQVVTTQQAPSTQ
ncbi:2576_t:CDS:2, partial [Acaulospora morrowiae]